MVCLLQAHKRTLRLISEAALTREEGGVMLPVPVPGSFNCVSRDFPRSQWLLQSQKGKTHVKGAAGTVFADLF